MPLAFRVLLVLGGILTALGGVLYFFRSNERKAKSLREFEDKKTLAIYESILLQIRCRPNDPKLAEEALRVGRWILSDETIKGDIADAKANR